MSAPKRGDISDEHLACALHGTNVSDYSSVGKATFDFQRSAAYEVKSSNGSDCSGSNRLKDVDEDNTSPADDIAESTIALLEPSIPESFRTIAVAATNASWWNKMAAWVGPGVLVAVGYMDPGNWSTDIAGGSLYKYSLLFFIIFSSLMAIFLQALVVRLAISQERDLAQLCKTAYHPSVSFLLWIIAEVAIAATDMAEVIGSAIALKLLFGLPIIAGVCVTVFDVLLILFLHRGRIRLIECLVGLLVSVIAVSFIIQLTYSKPNFVDVLTGYLPTARLFTDRDMLFVGISILGATVMPHNLYLHSSLVLTRANRRDLAGKREAIKFATVDSCVCLILAFFVNSFILIVAASAFYENGYHEVASLEDAYQMLDPVLGTQVASPLFAIALLASGQSATFTGTFAGQIVMEGFVNIKLPPSLRRLMTRLLAIVPAIIACAVGGDDEVNNLLLMSQVILSFALPFAVFPLVSFTSNKMMMGELVNSLPVTIIASLIFLIITTLNLYLLFSSIISSAQ